MYMWMCTYTRTYVQTDCIIQICKHLTKMENSKTLHKPESKNRKSTKKTLNNQFKLQPVPG